jgi:flavin reductase (DIM6/NTAB) family NADH-FMN oxidoreductase RutF
MPTRHSFGLISKSKQFVLNVVDEKTRRAVKICGENSGRDVDKFQVSGLTPAKATSVEAPLIEESPVNLECRVVKEVEISGHVWFISEVVAAHVEEGYDWENGLLLKWIGNERYYYKFGKKVTKF